MKALLRYRSLRGRLLGVLVGGRRSPSRPAACTVTPISAARPPCPSSTYRAVTLDCGPQTFEHAA